jgi:hypothetical protein
MKSDIEKCPFCKSEPKHHETEQQVHYFQCQSIGHTFMGPIDLDYEHAVSGWNNLVKRIASPVIMPEKKDNEGMSDFAKVFTSGWNAAIDELLKLNPKLKI